jgi:anion-transporting  ArsA/GET3 family ATPase
VAAALGVQAAERGKRTVVVEVARRRDVERVVTAAGADHLSVDPQAAMEEYLIDQLPAKALADVLAGSRAFNYFAAATPGMRELLTIGKVWDLAQDERRTHPGDPYDLVILDAPATGHALAMLAAPRTFAEAARVGPINRQGGLIHEMLSDPARTAVVGVTTPEEMPVNETLTLEARLRDEMGLDLALVVVNRVHRVGLTAGERRVLAGRDTHPAIAAALAQDRLAQAGRAQLQRLRRRVGAPTCTLSFVAGDVELDTLARRLGRAV